MILKNTDQHDENACFVTTELTLLPKSLMMSITHLDRDGSEMVSVSAVSMRQGQQATSSVDSDQADFTMDAISRESCQAIEMLLNTPYGVPKYQNRLDRLKAPVSKPLTPDGHLYPGLGDSHYTELFTRALIIVAVYHCGTPEARKAIQPYSQVIQGGLFKHKPTEYQKANSSFSELFRALEAISQNLSLME